MGFERFFLPDERPDEENYAAVAIFEPRPDQFHVALVYDTPSDGPRLLELRSHLDLGFAIFDSAGPHGLAIYWPDGAPIPTPRLESIAAMCRRIAQRHEQNGLPYSFALRSSLEENGEFVRGDTDTPGFTCATFVLAIFDAVGLPILSEVWPLRDEDEQRQRHLVDEIRTNDGERFEDIVGELPRYRPTEVAAGTLQDRHPATADEVRDCVDRIRKALRH